MKMPELTFNRKILLGVLPVVFISLIAIVLTNYFVVKNRTLKGIQYEINSVAERNSTTLKTFFEQRNRDIETLADAPLFADYYTNLEYNLMLEAETYREKIEEYLLKFSERTPIYHTLMYVDSKGLPVATIRQGEIVQKPKNKIFKFPKTMLREGFYRSPITKENQESFISYAKILRDNFGNFRGALILTCDLNPVKSILSRIQFGTAGRAYLADAEGRPVLGRFPNLKNPLFGKAPVDGVPWHIVIAASPEEILSPLIHLRNLTILFSIIAGIILGIVLTWIVRHSTKPIEDMVEGTHHLAKGDLSFRFEKPGIFELQSLAHAFNEMAQNLQRHNINLEKNIRQLTALRHMEESVIQRLDEDSILRTCLQAVVVGFSFDRTGLYWVDVPRKEIVGRHLYGIQTMGFPENSFRKRRIPLGGTDILNEVIQTRKTVLIKDTAKDPRLNLHFIEESKTREFVIAPICGKDRVFGILAADNNHCHRPLEESDKDGLTLFANAMGLTLENSTLLTTLAESEARYRAVLENSPVAVMGLSKEYWITTWNRGAEKIFGYRTDEIIGKPLTALMPLDCYGEFKSILGKVMEQGSIRDHPMTGISKDGQKLDLSISWGGTHQDFWINKEWSVVIRDVTEGKKLQQQVIRSEKLSAVGQLISCIAHELNNPLQAVIGYSQLLLDDSSTRPNPKKRSKSLGEKISDPNPRLMNKRRDIYRDLQLICDNSSRCRKIIDNLLLFVRHGEIEKYPVQIEQLIQASLDLLHYKLKKAANIHIDLYIPPDLPMVKADPQQIQQVFVNLINNACDAMMEWSGTKSLFIEAMEKDKMVRINVTDSGPGIPEKIQEKVFEPFFTSKTEGRGTGLGLTVCRQIMEDHSGTIGFKSSTGLGSTFWLELPISTVQLEKTKLEPDPLPPVLGRSVLIVDDEPDVLNFLINVVREEGGKTESASSLLEATLKASQKFFDLVIIDIRLDDGNAFDLYDGWTRWSRHSRPEFLFLTGDILNARLLQTIEKRDLLLLRKPTDVKVLKYAFRSLFSKKRNSSKINRI